MGCDMLLCFPLLAKHKTSKTPFASDKIHVTSLEVGNKAPKQLGFPHKVWVRGHKFEDRYIKDITFFVSLLKFTRCQYSAGKKEPNWKNCHVFRTCKLDHSKRVKVSCRYYKHGVPGTATPTKTFSVDTLKRKSKAVY